VEEDVAGAQAAARGRRRSGGLAGAAEAEISMSPCRAGSRVRDHACPGNEHAERGDSDLAWVRARVGRSAPRVRVGILSTLLCLGKNGIFASVVWVGVPAWVSENCRVCLACAACRLSPPDEQILLRKGIRDPDSRRFPVRSAVCPLDAIQTGRAMRVEQLRYSVMCLIVLKHNDTFINTVIKAVGDQLSLTPYVHGRYLY
jgi:hypothetical protein